MATFKAIEKEFSTKYAKEIAGISKANGVDLGVGKSMFEANLNNAGKGVKAYKGGGVATNWDEMVSDYKNLKTAASVDAGSKSKSKSSGGSINVGGTSQMKGSGQTSGSNGGNIGDFYKQASADFLANQKATFDKQLSQQLTDLESSYAQAISEGKISVRDAEAQFLEQKASIEQEAYKQFEATKAYSNEMGISNSQQALGLQQGDNARVRSTNNANLTDRDKRIADITDRINTLGLQKNLATTQANVDYGYNMAGANAQASQMYNQSVGGFMQEDYFSSKNQQHNYNMFDKEAVQAEKMFDKGAVHDKDMAEVTFQNRLKEMKENNRLDVSKMYIGHDLDLDTMAKEFENELFAMAKQNGYAVALENTRASNALKSIARSSATTAKSGADAFTVAQQRKALSLGLDSDASAWDITQRETALGIENGIKTAVVQAYTQAEVDGVFNNPDLLLNPVKPTKSFGNLSSYINYNKNNKVYESQTKAKTNAINNLNSKLTKYGIK